MLELFGLATTPDRIDEVRGAERYAGTSDRLHAFLLGTTEAVPSQGILKQNRLEPYAYTRLADDAPEKARLRPAFVSATARHLALRTSLQELAGAWRSEGIEALLFKGFYLAEFVYEVPAARPYSDIDVVIEPGLAPLASEVARELGWLETWQSGRPQGIDGYRASDDTGHEVLHLQHPVIGVRLDVHRRIISNNFPWTRTQERVTREAWSASQQLSWGQTRIRALSPQDSILIGLVLNRCWSADDWHLKAQDIVDFRVVVGTFGVTEASLEARAEQLQCPRTLQIFLARCDPFRKRLDLSPPALWRRHAWDIAIARERGTPKVERAIISMSHMPGTIMDIFREFPHALHAVTTCRSDPHLTRVGGGLEVRGAAGSQMSLDAWTRLQRGVRWAMRILRTDPGNSTLCWCFALFLATRRRGHEARLTVVRESSDAMSGIVRLEVGGTLVEEHRFESTSHRLRRHELR